MQKIFCAFILLMYSNLLNSQDFSGFIKAPGKFKKTDYAASYFNPVNNLVYINFQSANEITRRQYDTSFSLLKEYTFNSESISYSRDLSKVNFVAPLTTSSGTFEIFADKDDILVYRLDFTQKKDSLATSFRFTKKNGEKLISLLPDLEDLKILTYLDDENKLKIYRWKPGSTTEEMLFSLPKSNLDKEQEELYTKSCRIKFNKLKQLNAKRINAVNTFPEETSVFYSDNMIYMLLTIPFDVGTYVITLDLMDNTIRTKNYFLNPIIVNAGNDPYLIKRPDASVFDSTLIIKNTSRRQFEYYFYNIQTEKLLKNYSVPLKDSIRYLVHSPVIQKGTYWSRDDEKIRKNTAVSGFQNFSLTDYTLDSVTYMLFSISETEGVGGTLLSLATLPIGYAANFHIGNLQVIPYLTLKRSVLIYSYSKFSRKDYIPSSAQLLISNLDLIMDSNKLKDLHQNSSFFIRYDKQAIIGIFNKDKGGFEMIKFGMPTN